MTEPSPDALPDAPTGAPTDAPADPLPRVTIAYCTQCNWPLRAGWMAQELLSTSTRSGERDADPRRGRDLRDPGGRGSRIWERRRDGGFPDVKALKGRVRDRIAPGRDLGHPDRAGAPQGPGSG